jgi:hypothetical protein
MPGGPSATDGIVLDYRFLGSLGTVKAPYDQGKTLTHLVGNYLGLNDLWGNGHCADDLVDDTPPHNAPNFGCPGYRHISTCDDNPVEMTMNFMDNTDDACMYMFTAGQVRRMRAALGESGPGQVFATIILRAHLLVEHPSGPIQAAWSSPACRPCRFSRIPPPGMSGYK